MVDHQIIACPVTHQNITVLIQKVTSSGFYTGISGKGGCIIRIATGLNDLDIVDLKCKESQHHHNKQKQHQRTPPGYSFHTSPPRERIDAATGYSKGAKTAVIRAVTQKPTTLPGVV